eukprot:GILK01016399.1.p1 GENE.GILK01016399.1~~GILK01016399.1.p1  ORF type:complete len:515 (+),score=91.18 GILK01016399.1:35-1546(+)
MQQRSERLLGVHVESLWLAVDNALLTRVGSTLTQYSWAYGHTGLQMVVAENNAGSYQIRCELRIPFDEAGMEVAINDINPHFGILVGWSPRISSTANSLHLQNFEMRIQIQPFFHAVLCHMLRNGQDELAVEVCRQIQWSPFFQHTLELLLHTALEDELALKSPKKRRLQPYGGRIADDPVQPESNPYGSSIPSAKRSLLASTVQLTRQFPNFLDIVVACARKTDQNHSTKLLFPLVGDPRTLFEECFQLGRLRTASWYLLLLQNQEGPSVRHTHALRLLEAALSAHQLELVVDLIRFVAPEESYRISHQLNNWIPKSRETLPQSSEPFARVESYVTQYLVLLIRSGEWLKLLQLSQALGLELASWLHTQPIHLDPVESEPPPPPPLEQLHAAFRLPPPSESIQDEVPAWPGLPYPRCHSDLRLLAEVMERVECWDRCLLFCVILCRISKIVALLTHHEELRLWFKNILSQSKWVGYRQMGMEVEQRLQRILEGSNKGTSFQN